LNDYESDYPLQTFTNAAGLGRRGSCKRAAELASSDPKLAVARHLIATWAGLIFFEDDERKMSTMEKISIAKRVRATAIVNGVVVR
jgi:hypothetical protein